MTFKISLPVLLLAFFFLLSCGISNPMRESSQEFSEETLRQESVNEKSETEAYIETSLEAVQIMSTYAGEGSKLDGIYVPAVFNYSGGSGRVTISCEEVELSGGEAIASIAFSSPNYEYIRVDDLKITGEYTEKTSTFKVPVKLDEEMTLIGCTTAMSSPHEISYTIYISLDEISGATNNPASSAGVKDQINDLSLNLTKDISTIEGLKYDHSMELKYAKGFAVHYYENDVKLISVIDGSRYLVIPEGAEEPGKLPENTTVIRKPVSNIYLAATSAMSLFDAMGAMDTIGFTGTDVSGWSIEAPKEALESGRMKFAGKYSAPDYEMLLTGNCGLAIESTMILHEPNVKEQLEALGIPVFTDWSSYETSALGRTEWIRLYGALLDEEEKAEAFFKDEVLRSGADTGFEKTDKTVAFFHFNTRGLAIVRDSGDYVSAMIRDGGGINVFDSIDSGSTGISMEEFYSKASEADFLIYNTNIDTDVKTLSDLLNKSPLLKDFKAVKEGNVYLIDRKFYQSTDRVSEFAKDINIILTGKDEAASFLVKCS
ncbi:ABC transporter substrate-binding protein [Oribacterium sp. NK2B42]|uniref:ABC transporter substrate-binding protein n=1 Tax=Oribacterium sp. NK2B42 TaxID=689781 RepID=UPI0006775FB2|nr:ABC transporter substrate-binding protein [Oribacterium sp. NK2B42]